MRIQLSFVLALIIAGSFGSASQAALITGNFSGSVTDTTLNIPISVGNVVTGNFSYDTSTAVLDSTISDANFGFYNFPIARPVNFLEITVGGNTWASGAGFFATVSHTMGGGGDTLELWIASGIVDTLSYPGSLGVDVALIRIGDWGQMATSNIFSSAALPTSQADFIGLDPSSCCGGQIGSSELNGPNSWSFDFAIDPTSFAIAQQDVGIPEPSSTALLVVGLMGLLASRRRKS